LEEDNIQLDRSDLSAISANNDMPFDMRKSMKMS